MSSRVTGSYELVSCTPALHSWLQTLGVSDSRCLKAFRETRAKLWVQQPTKNSTKWIFVHKLADEGRHRVIVDPSSRYCPSECLDEEISATQLDAFTLQTETNVVSKQWRLRSTLSFSPQQQLLIVRHEKLAFYHLDDQDTKGAEEKKELVLNHIDIVYKKMPGLWAVKRRKLLMGTTQWW